MDERKQVNCCPHLVGNYCQSPDPRSSRVIFCGYKDHRNCPWSDAE